MSAIGTKRTSLVALHMSAIGGKADMMRNTTFKSFPLERSSHLTEFVPKVAPTSSKGGSWVLARTCRRAFPP